MQVYVRSIHANIGAAVALSLWMLLKALTSGSFDAEGTNGGNTIVAY